MTSRNRIGLAASLVLGALAFSAVAAPASAAWWGKDGQWHQDNRWNNNHNNDHRDRPFRTHKQPWTSWIRLLILLREFPEPAYNRLGF